MRIAKSCSAFLIFSLLLGLSPSAVGQAIVAFDFDTGTPALTRGMSLPLAQTMGGITAQFSSPPLSGFGVQTDAGSGWKMTQFSGNYLSPSSVSRTTLSIKFSQPLAAISVIFATNDLEIEVPSAVQLTAYMDLNTTPAVGTASARGRYGVDTFPTGTLIYDSGGKQFNLVEITIPFQTGGASAFLVDNIRATLFSPLTSAITGHVSAASYASGMPQAAGMIATLFGQGLASGTAAAATPPPPTTLANGTVAVKDSLGVERPAPLFYVSPTQINYVVPEATALGPATLTVASAGQATAAGAMIVEAVSPGLFTANFDGRGVPAANAVTVAPDQTQTLQEVARCGTAQGSCVASPLDLGTGGTRVVLVLYGTGIRGRSSLSAVTAKIGGVNAEVQYAGAQSQYVGLDQVNVVIPAALAGRGEVDLVITVDSKAANTVRVNIK